LNVQKQWIWIGILLLFTALYAEVSSIKISPGSPRILSYQGVLTDMEGTIVTDGQYSLTFSLYNVAQQGTALWTENQTVVIEKGIFNVILGDTVLMDLPLMNLTGWE
jgi:hypothetical protein